MSTKNFSIDGISANTQIGKGGSRIASAAGVTQTRTPDDSALGRHQGADPTTDDDFVTRRALNARRPIWPWWGNVNLQDQPNEIFISHDNNENSPVTGQDSRSFFLAAADVEAGTFVAKIRKAAMDDPDADITFRVYVEGGLSFSDTQSFSGDDVLRFVFPDVIAQGQKFSVSFEASEPIPNNAIVVLTMAIDPTTI